MTADSDATRRVKRASYISSITGVFAILVGTLAALGQISTVGAVDATGMFEMDGNILQDAQTAPPYDWASLFDANGNRLVTPDPINGPVFGDQFLSDAATPDTSYFSSNGAGVKDIDTLNNWGCTTLSNPLAKDDLQNAYAALIQIPNSAPENAGHTVLYLGSERGSNNGTSFAGFWLFKDKTVGCNTSTGSFNGAHTVGDLLVVSDYTNGGGTNDVSVYKWVGGNNPLSLVLSGGVCPTPATASGDSACAISNSSGTVTSPWTPTSHISNTFVEAAIDLNDLFAVEGGGSCFTTFMAETRSSNQLTATLKDFSGGQLNTCFAPPMVTTATPGGSTVLPGATQDDVATITGAPGKAAPTGTITFTLCGPSDVDSTGCPSGKGTQVGNPVTIASGGATSGNVNGTSTPNDLAIGKYCWRTDYTPDAAATNLYDPSTHTNSTTECFTVVKASPTLTTQIGVVGNGGAAATTLSDTASLHSFVGTVTGETITFDLFGPYSGTPTCATGTNEPVFSTTGTMNASGVAGTSATFQPQKGGTYVWVAHYGGDSLNSAADGACTDSNESTQIAPPAIHVNKTADAASVSAGTSIGFTVTISNTGTGTATGVTLTDSLPGGNAATPVHWVIDSGTGNPADFAIAGSDGSQTLGVTGAGTSILGGGSISVHVTAATDKTSCATYDNTASVTTGNDGSDQHSASETVSCPSIHVNKTADASPVNAGDTIGFTVTVTNTGGGDATGVTLTDALPGGNVATPVHWAIDTTTGNPTSFQVTGSDGSQALSLTTTTLAAGHSLVVHVTAATTKTSCATYDNTASASAANDGSDHHSAEVVVQCPSISVTKTADAASVSAGTAIGFTVTISNAGPGAAYGLTLSDALPGGNAATPVHWAIDSGTGNPTSFGITGSDGSQVLAIANQPITLASGGSLTVHITAATDKTSCTTYDNTAQASITNGSGAQQSASEQVLCASIHVTKTADAASVSAGQSIGFTVTVSNTGAGQATGVTLSDALPGGNASAPVHWVIDTTTGNPSSFSVTGSDGSQQLILAGQPVVLNSGASLAVHVTAATDKTSCTTYDNTAGVVAGNDGSDQKSASETVNCPSIHVDKTSDAAGVSAGTAIGFTVTVSNTGLGDAAGLSLTDALPGGNASTPVHWVIDTTTGDPTDFQVSGADGSQELSLTVTTLSAGDSLVVHVTAATDKTSCTTYDNTASASATNDDGDQHSASEIVNCPSLAITKTADAASVASGSAIGFTVTATNSGPGVATAATINDPLPSASGVSWSISPAYTGQGTCTITSGASGQTLVCDLGDMAVNATASVHVTSATTTASCTTFPNTATAAAGNQDPVQASATTSVICSQVQGIVSVPNTGADPGGPVGRGGSFGLIAGGLLLLLTGEGLRRRAGARLVQRRRFLR